MISFRSSFILFCAWLNLAPFTDVVAQHLDLSKNPWPAIRKMRLQKLLPEAMQRAKVEAWAVICRENNNDPLAAHVGGENARGAAAFLFTLKNGRLESLALSPSGEATALKDAGLHDRVIVLGRGSNLWETLAQTLRETNPQKIALNSSNLSVADGLSYTQRLVLEKALGAELTARLVPSEELVVEWLSVKLPEEVEILRQAAALTVQLELEAYKTIVPDKTKDSDVARFLKKRIAELGVEDAWAPEQNPNVSPVLIAAIPTPPRK